MGFPDYEFIEVETFDDGEIVAKRERSKGGLRVDPMPAEFGHCHLPGTERAVIRADE